MANPKPTVFISHITEERQLALLLKDRLEADFLGAIDAFVSSDSDSIKGGSNWLSEVDKALKTATFMVLLCSDRSIQRPWLNFEAGAGWVKGIQVMPLCHSGLRPADLPIPLKLLQGGELTDPEGLRRLYRSTAETIGLNVPNGGFEDLIARIKAFESENLAKRIPPPGLPDIRVTAGFGKFVEFTGKKDKDVGYPALQIRVENHSPGSFFLAKLQVNGNQGTVMIPNKNIYGQLIRPDRVIESANSFEVLVEFVPSVSAFEWLDVVAVDKIGRRFAAPTEKFIRDLAHWNEWIKRNPVGDWDQFRKGAGYFMQIDAPPQQPDAAPLRQPND
jgi:hypothetical protein